MKKTIIFLSLVCVVLALKVLWDYSKQKKVTLSISSVIGEKRFLNESFNGLLTVNSIAIDSVCLRHGEETVEI